MARAKKLPTSENDVKKLTKDWFDMRGGYSFAVAASHGMGQHGIADRVGCIPVIVTPEMVGKRIGLFVATECKAPSRRGQKLAGATKAQVDFLANVINHGGLAALVDSEIDLKCLYDALLAVLLNDNKHIHGRTLADALQKRISRND